MLRSYRVVLPWSFENGMAVKNVMFIHLNRKPFFVTRIHYLIEHLRINKIVCNNEIIPFFLIIEGYC